jgi:replicative DNA helicase
MRKGQVEARDWTTIASTRGRIESAPLYIDDSPNMTLVEIRAKARRLKQRVGLKMIVIDYLQLMTAGKRVESRQQEVSEFSRALKLLAKELQVPVVALSQLNRGPEQRADRKPQLSDLRESGSLEQDADVVILLHRDSAYEKDSARAGEADLIVAKHRNGPTATIVDSPMAESIEYRPPTQSQKPNIATVSMPKAATSAALVESRFSRALNQYSVTSSQFSRAFCLPLPSCSA